VPGDSMSTDQQASVEHPLSEDPVRPNALAQWLAQLTRIASGQRPIRCSAVVPRIALNPRAFYLCLSPLARPLHGRGWPWWLLNTSSRWATTLLGSARSTPSVRA
jgi:hypothetical protein